MTLPNFRYTDENDTAGVNRIPGKVLPARLLREPGHEELLTTQGWQALSYRIAGIDHEITIVRCAKRELNAKRLTPREFEVARFAAIGFAGKDVANKLSVSWTTARATLSAALGKLGLRSGAQLPGLWHGLGANRRSFNHENGMETLTFAFPIQGHEPTEKLTDAERDVLRGVLSGCSNREIAVRRKTSTRTVANQVAALFHKFGVFTRNELAAKALRRG